MESTYEIACNILRRAIVINKTADFISTINIFINSCDGLHNAVVEMSRRRIPINNLKPSEIETAATQQS